MPQRVPVLLMTHNLGLGGTERQMVAMAVALDRHRFEPHVGCLVPEGLRLDELRAADVPVVGFPVRSFASVGAISGALQLMQYLQRHRIRIVHTFDVPMNVFGTPVARLARTPIVLSSQRAFRDLSSKPYRLLLRGTDTLVDGIVVNCDAVRRHLIAEYGVAERRIHLCYNGIDADCYNAAGRAPSGLTITAGVVCAFRVEKGIETFLDAFALMRAKHPEGRLLLVGGGYHEAALRSRASQLGLDDICTFEPATTNVPAVLRRIDVFVLPSLSEALSNSLMEAMACGCCPIASNVGGNPELIEHNRTGLLFQPRNPADLAAQLERAFEDAALRQALATAAAAKIHTEMTLPRAAFRMAQIYETMLARER